MSDSLTCPSCGCFASHSMDCRRREEWAKRHCSLNRGEAAALVAFSEAPSEMTRAAADPVFRRLSGFVSNSKQPDDRLEERAP